MTKMRINKVSSFNFTEFLMCKCSWINSNCTALTFSPDVHPQVVI